MENKEKQNYWYHKVKGEKIPVSYEVYDAIVKSKEHLRYLARAEQRCGMSSYKRCTGDCSRCGYQRTGIFESIDSEVVKACLVADQSTSPEEILIHEETWASIFRFADKAAKNGKEILKLHLLENMNSYQIARTLKVSRSTIEYRIDRIFSVLRENQRKIF